MRDIRDASFYENYVLPKVYYKQYYSRLQASNCCSRWCWSPWCPSRWCSTCPSCHCLSSFASAGICREYLRSWSLFCQDPVASVALPSLSMTLLVPIGSIKWRVNLKK